MKTVLTIIFSIGGMLPAAGQSIHDYLRDIQLKGVEPIDFTLNALETYDLLIFDDGIHSAKEPFDFYQQLIQSELFQRKVRYVFVEMFSILDQEKIDRFLTNPESDSSLLYSVFQNNFNGYGNRYQTYYDLLRTVRKVNRGLPIDSQLRVIGVDQPIFWPGIQSASDYHTFNESLAARDYFMYKQILAHLNDFKDGKKAVFLTNTRHAYKNLLAEDGKPIWNCATFFFHWNRGKSCTVRIHNANLYVDKIRENVKMKTIEGTEQVIYRWVKIDQGKWDSAFALNGNRPVGFFLKQTNFGKTPYIGNQMLSARKGQTMLNVYDGLIFLAPLSRLTFSAEFNFICTPEFKIELKRRILLMNATGLQQLLEANKFNSVEELVDEVCTEKNSQRNHLIIQK